jgi:hypothetical protein
MTWSSIKPVQAAFLLTASTNAGPAGEPVHPRSHDHTRDRRTISLIQMGANGDVQPLGVG